MTFLDELIAGDGPVERQVTINGKAGLVWFKKITAGQRAALLSGMKYSGKAGEQVTYEVDLGANAKQKHMLVWFSVCKQNGKPAFNSLNDVQAIESAVVDALYSVASDVNTEKADGSDEDPGKV